MKGLSSIPASPTKVSSPRASHIPKKNRAPKETDFESALSQENIRGIIPSTTPESKSTSGSDPVEFSSKAAPENDSGEGAHSKNSQIALSKEENLSLAMPTQIGKQRGFAEGDSEQISADPTLADQSITRKSRIDTSNGAHVATVGSASAGTPLAGSLTADSTMASSAPALANSVFENFNPENLSEFPAGESPASASSGSRIDRATDFQNPTSHQTAGPGVMVNVSPLDRAALNATEQLSSSDRLWFSAPSSGGESADLNSADLNPNEKLELQKLQANALAHRVLKTNLSGSDFVDTLNAAKTYAGDLGEQGTAELSDSRSLNRSQNKTQNKIQNQGQNQNQVLSTDLENENAYAFKTLNAPLFGKPAAGKNSLTSEPFDKKGLSAGIQPEATRSFKSRLSEDLGKTLSVMGSHAGINKDSEAPISSSIQVSGNVVSGAMSKERLSSESLSTLTTNIRGLSGQGGGEIRMRLKPENLGELNIRVSTLGNQVELNIQSSDDRTKKIIEESIGYLKESMSSQNLNLASVDFSVASSQFSQFAENGDPGADPRSPHSQTGFQDTWSQQGRSGDSAGNRGGGSERAWGRDLDASARPMTSRIADTIGRQYSNKNLAGSGRIDVRG